MKRLAICFFLTAFLFIALVGSSHHRPVQPLIGRTQEEAVALIESYGFTFHVHTIALTDEQWSHEIDYFLVSEAFFQEDKNLFELELVPVFKK